MTDTPTPERGASVEIQPQPSFLRPQDFSEDFSHENGNYQCRCYRCGHTFVGHKRRVTCKLCVTIDALTYERDALAAECARLQAYADKLAEGLPMLPNDIALMQSGNADMATKLNAIDSACLKACPDNSAETMDEPDADVGRYLCLNENGDPLIDTDDPAEVVARLHELWGSVSEKCEAAEYKLSTLNPGAPRDGE